MPTEFHKNKNFIGSLARLDKLYGIDSKSVNEFLMFISSYLNNNEPKKFIYDCIIRNMPIEYKTQFLSSEFINERTYTVDTLNYVILPLIINSVYRTFNINDNTLFTRRYNDSINSAINLICSHFDIRSSRNILKNIKISEIDSILFMFLHILGFNSTIDKSDIEQLKEKIKNFLLNKSHTIIEETKDFSNNFIDLPSIKMKITLNNPTIHEIYKFSDFLTDNVTRFTGFYNISHRYILELLPVLGSLHIQVDKNTNQRYHENTFLSVAFNEFKFLSKDDIEKLVLEISNI